MEKIEDLRLNAKIKKKRATMRETICYTCIDKHRKRQTKVERDSIHKIGAARSKDRNYRRKHAQNRIVFVLHLVLHKVKLYL